MTNDEHTEFESGESDEENKKKPKTKADKKKWKEKLLHQRRKIIHVINTLHFDYFTGKDVEIQKISENFQKLKEIESDVVEYTKINKDEKTEVETKYREIIEIESTIRLLKISMEKYQTNVSVDKQKSKIKKLYNEAKKLISNNTLWLKFNETLEEAESIIEESVKNHNVLDEPINSFEWSKPSGSGGGTKSKNNEKLKSKFDTKPKEIIQSMPDIHQKVKSSDLSTTNEFSRINSEPKINSTNETLFNERLINLTSASSIKNDHEKIIEFNSKSDIRMQMKHKEIYSMQKGSNWFDGDYMQYHRFKKRIEKAFDNLQFDDDEKLDLLKNVVKERPSKMIEPVTTFEEAIETLDRVYTRIDYQKATIKEQLDELRKINNIVDFRQNNTFIETVHGCFEQLKRILPNEKDSFFIDCIRIILSKLPQETMIEFTKIEDDITPDKFIKFLIKQESIAERRDKWESSNNESSQNANRNARCNTIRPEIFYCKFHNNYQHSSSRCELSITEKLKIVNQNNWCKKCATHHKTIECIRKNLQCNSCGEDHLSYMHNLIKNETNVKTTESDEMVQHVQETKIAINKGENSYAETATARIVANGKFEDLRMIVDSASDFSFIDKKFVQQLNLKIYDAGLSLILRGINQSDEPKRTSKFTYLQFNTNNRNKIQVKFFIVDGLEEALGYSSNPKELNHLIPKEIMKNLADRSNNKLSALIGLDQRYKIYRPNNIQIIEKYVVIDTIFGFMISGNESINARTTRTFACEIEEDYEFKSSDEKFKNVIQPEMQKNKYVKDHKTNNIIMGESNRYVESLRLIMKKGQTIKNSCKTCRVLKEKQFDVPVGGSLIARICQGVSYATNGINHFGPMRVKISDFKRKVYILLIICLKILNIFLKIVKSSTIEENWNAIKRFMNDSGYPTAVLSDNSKAFIVTEKMYNKHVNENKTDQNILSKWHHITVYSPYRGGLWERAVKTVEKTMQAMTFGNSYKFEEFISQISDVQYIVNSRSVANDSGVPITPLMMFKGGKLNETIDINETWMVKENNELNQIWKRRKANMKILWNVWINKLFLHNSTYIHTKGCKESVIPKINDLVLLKNPKKNRRISNGKNR